MATVWWSGGSEVVVLVNLIAAHSGPSLTAMLHYNLIIPDSREESTTAQARGCTCHVSRVTWRLSARTPVIRNTIYIPSPSARQRSVQLMVRPRVVRTGVSSVY